MLDLPGDLSKIGKGPRDFRGASPLIRYLRPIF